MIDYDRLPNFFILGAAKSGTTSLFHLIAGHPQVFGSSMKETRFFSDDTLYVRGLDWYQETHFANSAGYPIRMEATPAYLTWSDKTAKRLHELYPNGGVKFAIIFRDPVARAYSHYWHRIRTGHETVSFEEAIRTEEARLKEHHDELYQTGNGLFGYLRASRYASRLQPFLERFDQSQFFFAIQEDLAPKNAQHLIADLTEFLEISPNQSLEIGKDNAPSKPRQPWIGNLHSKLKYTMVGKLYRDIFSLNVRRSLRQLIFAPTTYPDIDPEIEKSLREQYQSEIEQLEKIIQRDLSGWKQSD